MADDQKALAAFSSNEPINWLLGTVLRAGAERGDSHFLFEALAGKNPHAVKAWNAWIAEFRSALKNPDLAVRKANAELSTRPLTGIEDFITEVLAVVYLSRKGYKEFEAVLAVDGKPAVDFRALKDGKLARIEVKNLREPQDIIRTIAQARWKRMPSRAPGQIQYSGYTQSLSPRAAD